MKCRPVFYAFVLLLAGVACSGTSTPPPSPTTSSLPTLRPVPADALVIEETALGALEQGGDASAILGGETAGPELRCSASQAPAANAATAAIE